MDQALRETLAIVGSHPRTRSQFDFGRTDCDVWVFNEASVADWCKRADAVFQMHKPVIWKNPNNRNDPKHYEWLKSGKTPTIYMMEAYEEVPKAVKYPLDEVLQITPGVRYFTSSVAYAIALGIHYGYNTIELYGVEMETNTEYHYQREGVYFWLGVAIGKGIKVTIDTKLFGDPLYGYDGDVVIPYEKFEQIISEAKLGIDEAEKRYNKEKDAVNLILQNIVMGKIENVKETIDKIVSMSMTASQYGFADGRRQEAERYKGKADAMLAQTGEYIFSRQEYEQMIVTHGKARDDTIGMGNAFAGKLQAIFEEMIRINNKKRRAQKMSLFAQSLEKYISASTKVGVFDGARSVNIELLQQLDKLIRAAGGTKSYEVMAENKVEKMKSESVLEAVIV